MSHPPRQDSERLDSHDAYRKLVGLASTALILALLYLGREVLIPITLAILLGIVLSPFIRQLRHLGLGKATSIWVAVLLSTSLVAAIGAVIGSQVVRMGASLPQYEQTIRGKLTTLREATVGRMDTLSGNAGKVFDEIAAHQTNAASRPALQSGTGPIPVEIKQVPPSPLNLLGHLLSTAWYPVETAGVVFIVLLFVLLEQEELRDRLIRLAGGNDLRATTEAVNDASARLSRFFVSQFAVNLSVGLLVWLALMLIGVPQALLWGAMAAALRFVPYVGVWIAALCATLLAAAIAPGWSLALGTLATFFVIEMIVSQFVEPQLYGHSTGLSPLSVVIAAIFWSWVWGPVGLIVSTPLTLCLVVAGHYVPGLRALEIMFGEVRALTLSQSFYQRALSGDATEIVSSARAYLKQNSFARYCDQILMPALHLAHQDLYAKAISSSDQLRLGRAIGAVIETLGSSQSPRRVARMTLLQGATLGQSLRAQREQRIGRWQGPLDVPPGSIVLCISMGTFANDLATEVLVRVLAQQHIDARHLSLEDLAAPPPPGASPQSVFAVCLVSVLPDQDREHAAIALAEVHRRFASAVTIGVLLPSVFERRELAERHIDGTDHMATSFEEVVTFCEAQRGNPPTIAPR